MSFQQLFSKHKILVVIGSGGVGKTTVAASLGVLASRQGLRVLVLTIDPSRRLKNAMGLTGSDGDEVLVPGQDYKGKLFASVIDPQKTFAEFLNLTISDDQKREKILNNKLFFELSTSFNGSQEFTSLERMYQAYQSNRYDLIILDTPPAQHALEFLRAPQKIYNVFDDSVAKWFRHPFKKTHFLTRFIHQGTVKIFSVLAELTGTEFMSELKSFFEAIEEQQNEIQKHCIEAYRMLNGSETGFMLVTSFDEVKLEEAFLLSNEIQREGYSLKSVVINRFLPLWGPYSSDIDLQWASDELRSFKQEWHRDNHYKSKQFEGFIKKFPQQVDIKKVPEFIEDVFTLKKLERFSEILDD